MVRFWKTVIMMVGLFCVTLGLVSFFDALIHQDNSIVTLVSIVGFGGIGIALLSVANTLKYAIIDDSIGK